MNVIRSSLKRTKLQPFLRKVVRNHLPSSFSFFVTEFTTLMCLLIVAAVLQHVVL
jgi:hypothetical protein